ncbi:MaoC family dehydratase [Micrococcus luteus]|uniref:MaoC family dehydratase n=3 Tax=Actinomycetes TaxID=1760 RepID=A0AAP3ABC6_MICLU|nr:MULTISPECIES: MaoC family dehydratase [Micrococcus]OFT19728.1 dehydratase [Micrococcus sp. HMSC30C05]AWD24815.1 MaoC family dehydratase [Micrococcus luteus]AYO50912.1 MaoC family dehydratase [Micrococcus luteus]EZP55723.1 MaoC domain-containing protein dehydratase [Micrococcus luteus]KWW32488.1 putative enoyl-CoA hydratase 1 [Micrococcus luteus]
MQTFDGLDEFERAVGTHLGHSRWRTVTQEQVDLFADTTDDHQWIHVDPERAARGPFGSTVAHGFLTLALLPSMVREIYRVEGMAMVVNYGSDRVRFPHPTPVGARIRAGAELTRLDRGPQGALAMVTTTVEIEGVAKPACVSDSLFLLRPGKDAS